MTADSDSAALRAGLVLFAAERYLPARAAFGAVDGGDGDDGAVADGLVALAGAVGVAADDSPVGDGVPDHPQLGGGLNEEPSGGASRGELIASLAERGRDAVDGVPDGHRGVAVADLRSTLKTLIKAPDRAADPPPPPPQYDGRRLVPGEADIDALTIAARAVVRVGEIDDLQGGGTTPIDALDADDPIGVGADLARAEAESGSAGVHSLLAELVAGEAPGVAARRLVGKIAHERRERDDVSGLFE